MQTNAVAVGRRRTRSEIDSDFDFDFEEIVSAFNDAGVDYLVIGAYAVAAHARPRATGDIDLWVRPSVENAQRVYRALARFGAPMDQSDDSTFTEPDIVVQFGVPPMRNDVLTEIDGITFDEAWPQRIEARVGEVVVTVIGRDSLIRNKRASGRAKDLADLELLDAE